MAKFRYMHRIDSYVHLIKTECQTIKTAGPKNRQNFLTHRGGLGFLHSKGTWGCAFRKGMLFQTSSLAKGIRLGNVSLSKGMIGDEFCHR